MIRARPERLKELPTLRCCQVLEVSRSHLYESSQQKESDAVVDELEQLVKQAAEESPAYGHRRVSAKLRKKGYKKATVGRVKRHMRKLNLSRRRRAKRVRTSIPGKGPASPNLLKEQPVTGLRQALVTDITYVALPHGFAYVAVILDLFSRRALGWACTTSLHTELALAALKHALESHELPESWIHHCDRGCQYTSQEYKERVLAKGGRLSNSAKGNPYENANMESFFKTYKSEEVHLAQYDSLEEVRLSLDLFLSDYNSQRLHSSLGYCSPMEFEQLHAELSKQVCVR